MSHIRGKIFTALLATTALASPAFAQTGGTATQQGAGDETLVLDPLLVEGEGESAFGPVEGPYATQSATGTKTSTPLIETPQSITVIPRERIEKQGATSISEALRYSSGITGENRGGVVTRYDMFHIRGFQINRYYLNGLILPYNGWYDSPQVDASTVERVEILKGPASVLYGTSPPGGLVNMVSKMPAAEESGRITLGAGTGDLVEGTIDMTGALDETGEYSYRFIGAGRSSDGQAVTTEDQRYLFAPSLTWAPTDRTNLTFLGYYQHDPKAGAFGAVPALGSVQDNPLGNLSPDFYDGDTTFEEFDRKQYGAGYIFSHEFDGVWSFRQNFRYNQSGTDYKSVYSNGLAPDNRTLLRASIFSDEYTRAFAIDNQVTARFETGAVKHTLLAGLDYQHLNSDIEVGYGTAPPLDIFNPDNSQGGIVIGSPWDRDIEMKTRQTGFYLQDQMQWNGFTLLLGARQDWYERDDFERLSGVETKLDQDELSLRAGLLYKFDSGFAPYISYAESFEPQSGQTAGGSPFKPTIGKQYEAGIKYEAPNERAFVTLSVFDLTRENVPTADPVNPTFSIQTGEVTSKGFEVEAQFEPLDGWNIAAFYTWLDLEVTKDNSGLQGTTPTWVADQTASLWTDYRFDEGPLRGFTIGGGARYTGETEVDPANAAGTTSPFTLFDAMVSYDLGHLSPQLDGTSVQLNAANLTDKRHVAGCYNAGWCWFGAERQVKLTLAYQW